MPHTQANILPARLRPLALAMLLLVLSAPLAHAQETTVEEKEDSVIFHTKPQRAHYKVYASDWAGLLLNAGKVTLGREWMVGKDVTAEAELGVRIMANGITLDNPLFQSYPGAPKTFAGPHAGLHFRFYPEVPIIGDAERNFVGVFGAISTEMSLVYFPQLDVYKNNDFRPLLQYQVTDADMFSLRITPSIGMTDFWKANAKRGFTLHGQVGYTLRWDKIQGEVHTIGLNVFPRPQFLADFRRYPTFRFGVGYAF